MYFMKLTSLLTLFVNFVIQLCFKIVHILCVIMTSKIKYYLIKKKKYFEFLKKI